MDIFYAMYIGCNVRWQNKIYKLCRVDLETWQVGLKDKNQVIWDVKIPTPGEVPSFKMLLQHASRMTLKDLEDICELCGFRFIGAKTFYNKGADENMHISGIALEVESFGVGEPMQLLIGDDGALGVKLAEGSVYEAGAFPTILIPNLCEHRVDLFSLIEQGYAEDVYKLGQQP